MKQAKLRTTAARGGYTMAELLFVVTIVATMGMTALMSIGGQQQRNEFTQAVRDFETKLLDIANDVARGHYPNPGVIRQCTAGPGGISFGAATVAQGASRDCVFAGRAVELRPDRIAAAMRVQTIAARRLDRQNNPVDRLGDLRNGDLDIVPNVQELVRYLHGLRVRSVNGGQAPGTIVFMTGFAHQASSGLRFSGGPPTFVYHLNNTRLGHAQDRVRPQDRVRQDRQDRQDRVRQRIRNPANYGLPDQAGIRICLEHGHEGRRALVVFGRSGGQLTTETWLEGDRPAGDRICV